MQISRTPWFILLGIVATTAFSSCSNIFHDLNNQQLINAPASPLIPRIEYVFPAADSESAALNKTVLISFNKPMAMETVPAGTFRVINESTGNPVNGSFHIYDRRLVIFDPSPPENTYLDPTQKFDNQTWHQVTLERPIQDMDGLSIPAGFSWRFKTGDSFDITPVTVNDSFPHDGDLVGPQIEIRASLTEDINPASLTTATFTLTMKQHGLPDTPITGTVSYRITPGVGAWQYTAIFRPDTALPMHKEFKAILTTGISDLADKHLENNHSWSFSTGSVIAPLEAAGNARYGAGTFGAPGIDYGYVLTDDAGSSLPTRNLPGIFDQGTDGPLTPGTYLRIVSGGKNITDPTGLNLTPTFKRLLLDRLVSPPANQCYIDTVNGIFVLPRPIYWSKMDSFDSIVNPEIGLAGSTPAINVSHASLVTYPGGGKFGSQCLIQAPGAFQYGASFYPFGSEGSHTFRKGTISFWTGVNATGPISSAYNNTYLNDSTIVQLKADYNGVSSLSILVNGVTEQTISRSPRDAWHHCYIVWDADAGLSGGRTIRVFFNSEEVLQSSTSFTPGVIANGTTVDVGLLSWAWVSLDNFKVWNHVVTEDPSFEYNGGAGNENGLHAIYGPSNNYVPDLTSPGNGVGYYYIPTEN